MKDDRDGRGTLPDAVLAQAWNMHNRGYAPREIADRLGMSIREVQQIIDQGIMAQHHRSAKVRPETEAYAAQVQAMIRPSQQRPARR